MEHTRNSETFSVLLRFLRRYWRIPAQVAGVLAMLVVLLLALPFLPRFNGRLEASSPGPANGGGGAVESLVSKGVGTPFAGLVASTAVNVGQSVKKGDLLFKMDITELKAQLAAARADVATAQGILQQARQGRDEQLGPLRAQVRQLRRQLAAEQSAVVAAPAPEPLVTDEGAAEFGEMAAEPVQWVAPDPARLEAIRATLAAASAQLAEESRQWYPAVRDAERQLASAHHAVNQHRGRIAMAERRSPMDGVVTSVNIRAGQWAPSHQPVVQVDKPDGYRVVVLVDKATRERLPKGATVPLTISGTPDRGKLEKVVAGWDKDLYSYWLWFKPSHPEKLHPGQAVGVDLTPVVAVAAGS
jgi:multidrug efflux pump subunit AcrA (membrane-fusion protein)